MDTGTRDMIRTLPARELMAAGRRDFYGPVHKGLRLRHAQLLQRLGQADFSNDVGDLLAELRTYLHMVVVHLVDEEVHVHHRLAQRLPGGADTLDEQHANHRRHIVRLREEIARLEADPVRTPRAGHTLYLAFSRFVADDLGHMAYEEESTWPVLCALFSDAELAAIEAEIVAGLAPGMAGAFTAAIIAGSNDAQRVAMLRGMRAAMPAQDYAAVFETVVRPALPAGALAHLDAHGLVPAIARETSP